MKQWILGGLLVVSLTTAGVVFAEQEGGYPWSPQYDWGMVGDIPLAGDFDGDCVTDITIYRPSTGEWYIRRSGNDFSTASYTSYQWGGPGYQPVIGDFNGDGRTDFAVFKSATGRWYVSYNQLFSNYGGACVR